MGYDRRLNQAFRNAPVLSLTPGCPFVLFSDCHRGDGSGGDNFLKNRHLYSAALKYYYEKNFTYIELGDGDELWENRCMEQITEIHSDIFCRLANFYRKKRLYMIYGNHDIVKKYASFARKKCSFYAYSPNRKSKELFPGICFYSGIILKNENTNATLYLTHGHQTSLFNSTLWPVNCFLVRYVWRPLEQIGILDPTSAAKNYTTKKRSEDRLISWAKHYNRLLITGHTHRPTMSSELPYMNTGSCIHPQGITCIEVYAHKVILVKWLLDTKEHGDLYVNREELTELCLSPD